MAFSCPTSTGFWVSVSVLSSSVLLMCLAALHFVWFTVLKRGKPSKSQKKDPKRVPNKSKLYSVSGMTLALSSLSYVMMTTIWVLFSGLYPKHWIRWILHYLLGLAMVGISVGLVSVEVCKLRLTFDQCAYKVDDRTLRTYIVLAIIAFISLLLRYFINSLTMGHLLSNHELILVDGISSGSGITLGILLIIGLNWEFNSRLIRIVGKSHSHNLNKQATMLSVHTVTDGDNHLRQPSDTSNPNINNTKITIHPNNEATGMQSLRISNAARMDKIDEHKSKSPIHKPIAMDDERGRVSDNIPDIAELPASKITDTTENVSAIVNGSQKNLPGIEQGSSALEPASEIRELSEMSHFSQLSSLHFRDVSAAMQGLGSNSHFRSTSVVSTASNNDILGDSEILDEDGDLDGEDDDGDSKTTKPIKDSVMMTESQKSLARAVSRAKRKKLEHQLSQNSVALSTSRELSTTDTRSIGVGSMRVQSSMQRLFSISRQTVSEFHANDRAFLRVVAKQCVLSFWMTLAMILLVISSALWSIDRCYGPASVTAYTLCSVAFSTLVLCQFFFGESDNHSSYLDVCFLCDKWLIKVAVTCAKMTAET